MSEKRYFKVEYDEEGYLFDSNTISEELVTEQAEYGYGVFANSLSPSEICERLNEQEATIQFFKGEIDELKKDIDIYKYEEKKHSESARKLYEENEQLKEERNYFERKKCEYFNKYNKKHLDNIQLKEENEQLKKRLEHYAKVEAMNGDGKNERL